MRTRVSQRLAMLRQMPLFRDLEESDLAEIAARLEDYLLPAGDLLYNAGDRAENFYILHTGRLQTWQPDEEQSLAILDAGEAFGAAALLRGSSRGQSVAALTDSALLYMGRTDFDWLLETYPVVNERLQQRYLGRRLRGELQFDWLRQDETVHFVARKHSAYLWFRWARAMLAAILGLLSINAAISNPSGNGAWLAIGGGLLGFAGLWAVWEYLDWRNDYYVLTNLRVVWLEQVLLRSSSRKEAPLASIQSVDIHTGFLGRLLGYGDVIVRTYTGSVLMPVVTDPHQVKHMIEDYVARLRALSRESKHEAIRDAIRQSLGQAPAEGATADKAGEMPAMKEGTPRYQLFSTRRVEGDTITYHKHWFVLFTSLLPPSLFGAAAFLAVQAFGLGAGFYLLGLGIPLSIFVYRLLDWQNDIYRVTPDSLMDSEKKPLGSEVTKSASLANVLSLENHRVGILGLLLNFGVVRINVGDSSLDFVDVHDPARIQQDIFLRMEALKLEQQESQADEERRRLAEWMKIYEEERGGARPAVENSF